MNRLSFLMVFRGIFFSSFAFFFSSFSLLLPSGLHFSMLPESLYRVLSVLDCLAPTRPCIYLVMRTYPSCQLSLFPSHTHTLTHNDRVKKRERERPELGLKTRKKKATAVGIGRSLPFLAFIIIIIKIYIYFFKAAVLILFFLFKKKGVRDSEKLCTRSKRAVSSGRLSCGDAVKKE